MDTYKCMGLGGKLLDAPAERRLSAIGQTNDELARGTFLLLKTDAFLPQPSLWKIDYGVLQKFDRCEEKALRECFRNTSYVSDLGLDCSGF